jgi:hypothetical protein
MTPLPSCADAPLQHSRFKSDGHALLLSLHQQILRRMTLQGCYRRSFRMKEEGGSAMGASSFTQGVGE